MKIKVAVIGANGQLGTDVLKIFLTDPNFTTTPLTHKDIEITDKDNTIKVLEKISPEIVINTAAYHKVDEVEDNPGKAFLVNGIAVKHLAEYCQMRGKTIVFLSTDYVFGQDINRDFPYVETDRPAPVNVYGVSKLAGEYFIGYICSKFFIIRSSGLFGTAGSSGKGGNFVELMLRLARENQPIKVVNDQILSPTYTENLAAVLHELIKTSKYGIYHAASEGECSWYEFAKKIFELTKIKARLKPTTSDLMDTRAKRPMYSVLKNHNLNQIGLNAMNDWEKNLELYLKEKNYI